VLTFDDLDDVGVGVLSLEGDKLPFGESGSDIPLFVIVPVIKQLLQGKNPRLSTW
jgi:hypothetical protein